MLGAFNATVTIPVADLETSKKFYEETLGFVKVKENPGGVDYKSGNSEVFVYPSEYAGTNKGTTASWTVENVQVEVDELKSKGVVFEHYDDMQDVALEGDVHVMGDMKMAWFKDPSGNILAIDNIA